MVNLIKMGSCKGRISPMKGKHHSEETKRKMSERMVGNTFALGSKHTDEWKQDRSKATRGKTGEWNHTEETKKKISESQRGKKRKPLSEEHKQKIRNALKGRSNSNKGIPRPQYVIDRVREANLGKKATLEHRIKNSCSHKGISIEEWDGFSWMGDYCEKFDHPFRERVRNFFGRKCVNCGKLESDNNGRKLSVHHVTYDKNMCCHEGKPLFVCLCTSCHAKTQAHREHWKQRFIEIIYIQFGGKCYDKAE